MISEWKERMANGKRQGAPRRMKKRAPRVKMDTVLKHLTAAELVRRLDDVEPAYIFKHVMVQETAQATLLKNQYKRLHKLVAQTLERMYAKRLDEFAAELAEHFAEAEEDAKTFEYALRAGNAAARVYANQEALTQYGRAVNIARRLELPASELVQLYTRRGRVLEVISEYQTALASYVELYEIGQARGDRQLQLAALQLRATLHSGPLSTFDSALAMQLLLDALGTARELNDRVAEAQILWALTLLNIHQSRPHEAAMYGEQSLALARELEAQGLDMRERIAFAQHELVTPYYATGQTARAQEFSEASRALWRKLDNQSMLVDSLGVAAQAAFLMGKYADGLKFSIEADEISRAIGNWFGWMFTQTMRGSILIEQGDWSSALALFDQIVERGSHINLGNQFIAGGIKAFLLAQLGALDAAREMKHVVQRALDRPMPEHFRVRTAALFARTFLLCGNARGAAVELDPFSGGEILERISETAPELAFARIELAVAQQDFERALTLSDQAHELVQQRSFDSLRVELLYLRGRALEKLQQPQAAIETWQEARQVAKRLGARRMLSYILPALSAAERARGNLAQAEQYRVEARAVLEYIVEHTSAEYRESFLNLPTVRAVTSARQV